MTHTLSPPNLAEDFAIFRTALEEAHPGLYRYTPKAEFDALFEQIAASLTQPLSEQEFYQALNPAIVALRCGHTKFHPERESHTPYYYHLEEQLPLRLFVAGERLWIQDNLSNASQIEAGAEILKIGELATADIVKRLLKRVSFADGAATSSKYLELSAYFSAYYTTFIDHAPRYEITYTPPHSDQRQTATLTAVSDETLMSARQATDETSPLQFDVLNDSTVLLTIQSFRFESRAINYHYFLRHAFKEIQKRGVKHVIIDLRDNEGGTDAYGALLYAYLTDQRFRYYDHIEVTTKRAFSFRTHARLPFYFPLYRLLIAKDPDHGWVWKYHANLKEQNPAPNAFRGDVYILVNGRSFSVTAEFAAIAKEHQRATFIGQETGGGYAGHNSGLVAIVTLPHSHFVLDIPLWGYYLAVENPDAHPGGVQPDYPIEYSIEDVLAGRDLELDCALRLIEGT